MNHPETHLVRRTEHHVLSTCPCNACRSERNRRKRLVNVSYQMARALGFKFRGSELPPPCHSGSKAEELSERR